MVQVKVFKALTVDEMKRLGVFRDRLDFSFTDPDELVTIGTSETSHRWDGDCGCGRALVGINSCKATTAFTPVLVERDALLGSKYVQSWSVIGFTDKDLIGDMTAAAKGFEVGDIVQFVGKQRIAKTATLK